MQAKKPLIYISIYSTTNIRDTEVLSRQRAKPSTIKARHR